MNRSERVRQYVARHPNHGYTTSELARKFGLSRQGAHDALRVQGLRRGARGKRTVMLPADLDRAIVELARRSRTSIGATIESLLRDAVSE